jgi:hypothetical protein
MSNSYKKNIAKNMEKKATLGEAAVTDTYTADHSPDGRHVGHQNTVIGIKFRL